jgi:D-alanyl-D-alanine carboxypeptidase (penicillin-binding protein 5/6)
MSKKYWLLFLVVVLAIIYVSWGLNSKPIIVPLNKNYTVSNKVLMTNIKWPTYGQAAIGINNSGVVATHGINIPMPTASTAKLITALCVLKKYPLTIGQTGPIITITPSDVAIYNKYQAGDGSDMFVFNGEKLTEYQMLEAMLLPSADNIADSLAIWAFGSLSNYKLYASQLLKDHKLYDTHIGIDASGYSPTTTSTAYDLVKIGEMVMNNQVLSSIAAKPTASGFPVVGTIKNVNFLLGQNNIVGIKTGNTNQAGGVFVSASKILVNNNPVTIITALMQAPNLFDAMIASKVLVISAQSNFINADSVFNLNKGAVVGEYNVPWQNKIITAITTQTVNMKAWGGSSLTKSIDLNPINSYNSTQMIGNVNYYNKVLNYKASTGVELSQMINPPSKLWILTHPSSFIHF